MRLRVNNLFRITVSRGFARLVVVLVCVFSASDLYAANFTVTKTADTNDGTCDADCSLREAVIAANAAADVDTINLPSGNYILTIPGIEAAALQGDLDILQSVNITGAGVASTVIDGRAGQCFRDLQPFECVDLERDDPQWTGSE